MIYVSIFSWDLNPSYCVHCCPEIPSLLYTISPWCRTAERSQTETETLQSKASAVLRSHFQLFQITAVHLPSATDHREHASLSSFSSLVPHWQLGWMQGFTLPFKSPKWDWFQLPSALHTAWLPHHLCPAGRMDLSASSKYCKCRKQSSPKDSPWPRSSLLERHEWRGTTVPEKKAARFSFTYSVPQLQQGIKERSSCSTKQIRNALQCGEL